jgi:hypothetical protein
MRTFYEKSKYRWEMTNEHGWEVSKQDVRDNRINQVLGSEKTNIDLHYTLALKKTDESGWGQYIGLYKPKNKKLIIYPLSENGGMTPIKPDWRAFVRVEFIAEDIEECETYVDLVCKGNSMILMPVNIK